MKITIAGYGKVGSTIAEQLVNEKHDITIVDTDPIAIEEARTQIDASAVLGNCASTTVLKESGIRESDLLIAVTQSDEVNLLCCLIAKRLGAKKTIARVRNPVYSEEISLIKDDLGLSMAVNPELEAADEIARLLKYPSASNVETFAKGRVEILQYKLNAESPLCDIKIMDIVDKLKFRLLICAVERGDEVTIPTGQFVLKEGDNISFVIPSADVKTCLRKLRLSTEKVKNIIIVGGGRLTYYLAKNLIEADIGVKIIEQSKERCEEISEDIPDALIINADGTDCRLLEEESLSSYDAVATLTGNDEQNILLSMYTSANYPETKIITKIKHSDYDEILKNVNIGSVVSPKHITADHIVRYVRAMQNSFGSNVQSLHRIVSDKVEALEFRVKEKAEFTGVPLQNLKLKSGILIGSINRGGTIITPQGSDTIEVGDTVIVVTTRQGLYDLSDIVL